METAREQAHFVSTFPEVSNKSEIDPSISLSQEAGAKMA
jgi:hypothetical protein